MMLNAYERRLMAFYLANAAAPAGSGAAVHRLLLDAAPASELDWSDFDHVARDRDHIRPAIGRPASQCSAMQSERLSHEGPRVHPEWNG